MRILEFFGLAGGWMAMNRAPDRPVASLKARWAPAPFQFVPIAGMDVHLRDEGPRDDPMPIVLVHGTSASLHTRDGWVEALKGQHRVIRVDLPGFGLAGPSPDGDYSLPACARFMVQVMDRRLIAASVRNVYADSDKVTPALIDRCFELTLREGNREALRARLQAGNEAFTAQSAQIKQPTLVLWGAQDRLIPPAQAQFFARDITGSQLQAFLE